MDKYSNLGLQPYGATPSKRQLEHMKIGKKAFFHFGVNTFTDLEWGKGKERQSIFNPSQTDVRQWIRIIKKAGFKLAILTAKHHDGFCLWPSKYTEHNISRSPYKNGKGDLVREFCDACREYGIKAGLYLSPWDRNSAYWGTSEYSDFYAKQLTELVTQYGELHEIWWDGAGSQDTPYDWGLWAYIIRNYQPNAAIFGSMGAAPYVELRWVGNESGYAADTHYACIEEKYLTTENREFLNSGVFGGERYIPAEVDVSIRPGWFYHKEQDSEVKTVSQLNKIWFDSIGKNAMLLLNFPPDRRGLIFETDAQNAIKSNSIISKMLSENLAVTAKFSAESIRCEGCEPENMLLDNDKLFYAPADDCKTPIINLEFFAPVSFNVITIGEKIELGERVKSFSVEYQKEGVWVEILRKNSIGFFRADYFETVSASKVRIIFHDFADVPVIKNFGMHILGNEAFDFNFEANCNINLLKNPGAEIIYSNNNTCATISLGGIYPFNNIQFECGEKSKNTLFTFDGSKFNKILSFKADGKTQVIDLGAPVRDCYQIKIESSSHLGDKDSFKITFKK